MYGSRNSASSRCMLSTLLLSSSYASSTPPVSCYQHECTADGKVVVIVINADAVEIRVTCNADGEKHTVAGEYTDTLIDSYTETYRGWEYTHTLTRASTHTLIHSYTHTLLHSYTPTLLHSYTHTLIHSYTPTLLHSYTHTPYTIHHTLY
jgi:hypothetical protein